MTRQFKPGDVIVETSGPANWLYKDASFRHVRRADGTWASGQPKWEGEDVWGNDAAAEACLDRDNDGRWTYTYEPVTPTRKFKVGDRVEYIGGKSMSASSGATATVTGYSRRIYGPGEYLDVKWDDTPQRGGQMHGGYDEDGFKPYVKPAVTFKDGDIFFEPHCVRVRKDERWYFAHDGIESSVSDPTLVINANAGVGHKVDQTVVKPLTYTGGEVVFQQSDVLMFRDNSIPLVYDGYKWYGWSHSLVRDDDVRRWIKNGDVLHRKDQLTLTLKPVQVEPKRAVFRDGDIVRLHHTESLLFRRDGQWGYLRAGSVSTFFSRDEEVAAEIERGDAHLIDINAREKG